MYLQGAKYLIYIVLSHCGALLIAVCLKNNSPTIIRSTPNFDIQHEGSLYV